MILVDKFVRMVNDAQVASAVVYPTSPYTGNLPTKTVKKGSKGTSVKRVQKFLNWCIKAGLTVDGSCGKKTVSAIKKFQKQYKLSVDGVFGPQCRKKAKALVSKYAAKPTPAPTPTPTPAPTPASKATTWVDNANAWAKKIAADNSYHYVKWSSNEKTHECPICHKHPKGKYHGWNCIGFAHAVWHHGGKLGNRCNCYIISNQIGNQMLKMSQSEMLATAKKKTGLKDIKVLRNKKGIPKSQWKAGDICLQYNGSKYVHTFYYMGNGKVADSTGSSGKVPNDKQIAVRSYNKYTCKIILRYTGK